MGGGRAPGAGGGPRRATPVLPVAAGRGGAVEAEIRLLGGDGQQVGWFRLEGGKHRGAIGTIEGETIARLIRSAVDAGVPIVGVLSTSGADVAEGVSSLHAWGGIAHALAQASGLVPIVLVVTGPAVSGPALLLGLADVVVMTEGAFAYVSGPDALFEFTGVRSSHESLGGTAVHATRSGVASFVAADEDEALAMVYDVLSFLPPNNGTQPSVFRCDDPVDRPVHRAVGAVPAS